MPSANQLSLTDVYNQFARTGRMNAVAVSGSRILRATVGFLDTSPAAFAAQLLGGYGADRPELYSKSAVHTGSANSGDLTHSVTGLSWPVAVYGVQIDISAAQTVALGNLEFQINGKTPWNDTIASAFTIETPAPDTLSGAKTIRMFYFHGVNLNGIFHYVQFGLNNVLETTNMAAKTIGLDWTSEPPSGTAVSLSLLTRGHPQVDDLVRYLASGI